MSRYLGTLCLCFWLAGPVSALAGRSTPQLSAAAIIDSATALGTGDFIFKNVQTGMTLTYTRDGLYPARGPGTPVSIKSIGKYTVLAPTQTNNKCLSAQWDSEYKADWALALYACRVTTFRRLKPRRLADLEIEERQTIFEDRSEYEQRTYLEANKLETLALRAMDHYEKRGISLRLAKQYFYLIPATTAGSHALIAADHIQDSSPRAMSSGFHSARTGNAKMVALEEHTVGDKSQEWVITKIL